MRLPRVTLHLHGSRELKGFHSGAARGSRRGDSIVLHALSANTRRTEPDVIFVRPESIKAITVFP